jgi:hypothetical protein
MLNNIERALQDFMGNLAIVRTWSCGHVLGQSLSDKKCMYPFYL